MRVSGTFTKTSFKPKRITKRLRGQLIELQKNAVAHMITTIQSSIPVLTGRAKGTWLDLQSYLTGVITSVELDFTPDSPYWTPGTPDLSHLGPQHTEFAFEHTKLGTRFFVRITLDYYETWDRETSPLGRGFWNTMQNGREAYRQYIYDHFYDHITFKIQHFIVRTRVAF